MLAALLGELHFIPDGPNAWFNLPRGGGVAYAAQESWVQNTTIRVSLPTPPKNLANFDRKISSLGQYLTRNATRKVAYSKAS